MKAFEKWCGSCYDKEVCKAAWKAALEWALAQPDGSCGVRKCIPMEAMRDELEASDE